MSAADSSSQSPLLRSCFFFPVGDAAAPVEVDDDVVFFFFTMVFFFFGFPLLLLATSWEEDDVDCDVVVRGDANAAGFDEAVASVPSPFHACNTSDNKVETLSFT